MSTSGLDHNALAGDQILSSWDPLADITHVTVVPGCGCAACQALGAADGSASKGGINQANPDNQNIGVLLPLVGNPDGSWSITGIRNVDATLIGSQWGVQHLTFSFPTSGSNYNGKNYDSNGVSLYHMELGSLQQAAARAAFAQISSFTNLTFTEIAETDSIHGHIRLSQSADNDVTSAYGGFPSDTRTVAGDIWFGRTNQPYYDLQMKGTWGFSTMLHEIGHTMGLKHGHQSYTFLDLSFYFGTSPRPGTQSLTADHDGQAWSLMTYTPAPGTSGFAGEKMNQPQTYMQYDIAALQYMYGANYDTNSGDTVYSFSQTTGEMFINGVGQGAPSGNRILLTIWDGGGNDTIDASNYSGGVTIDLRPGQFSTLDQGQLANHLAYQAQTALAPGNIAMSLLYNNDGRSLIENATGGAGDDIFIGNAANNILDGGAGSDTVIFTGTAGVNVTLNDTGADVVVTHGGETDILRSIENITGTAGNDTLTGNSQDNTLNGGAGGADTLSGGDGNDRLIGGGFTTTTTRSAPSQPDIEKPATTNNGSIATAVNTAGAYDIDANPNITNSTVIPHATVNATATGGTLEYYRVDVTAANTTLIFDIDTGTTGTLTDSIIELVNSAGVQMASNDTGPGDVGTSGNDDSYLSFTFTTPGTYYIRVGRWTSATGSVAQPLLAGQTYTLHISNPNGAVVTTTTTANNTSSLVADGGAGDDFIQGTLGNDILDGGAGNDTASFVTAFSDTATGVTVDLTKQGTAQNTGAAGSDTLIGIENLIGSQYNDTLIGDAGDNVIEGGLGNDVLIGGAGNDTASYAGSKTGVTVSLGLQGTAQNTGTAGTDTLSGFENLLGSAFNDSLTGDSSANTLSGGAGDDTLNPGLNAGGAVDLLDGGIGSDTASFAGYTAAVTATLNGTTDVTATVGGIAIATLRSIENLLGGAGADILTGDANANVINGGLGNDVLDGGAGVDTVSFTGNGTTAITVNLGLTTAQVTGVGTKTILNFENVRTGAGADNITGNAGDNIFYDGGGNDIYNGGAHGSGGDTVDYSASTSSVTVNLNTTTAQNVGIFGGLDTITNIENVVGAASFANTLTGNTLGNRLTGGALADVIVGNNGNDVIFGGAGNDFLLGGTSGALDDNSVDILEGGAGHDYLSGGGGDDILRGGDGDDILNGGLGTTTGTVFSNEGGIDTFDGGDGHDVAYLMNTDQTGAIAFDLANLAGNSAITLNGVVRGSFTSIEQVIFRGGSGADTVRGTGSADTLVGNAGDDVLDGWLGNDVLSGGLGNDTLNGGEGLDTATYVNSTAGVNVDLRIQGTAQNTGGEGWDTLISIEYLTGSNFGDTLRGNDDFNLIIDNAVSGPAGQTDSLFGYGGNDSLLVTRAAAAVATNIHMDGGEGNDFIELRSGTLSSALLSGDARLMEGLSTTQYMALGTTGTRYLDVVTVDGGAGNDRIVLSGVKSAVIDAGSGNDIVSLSLLGSATESKHTVTLGAGQDIIQFAGIGSGASTIDHGNVVTDFEVGNSGDKFEMTQWLNGVIPATGGANPTPANPTLVGYTANSDPFASGHLRLVQSGTDLLLQVDRDAGGSAHGFVTVFKISNGYTGGFTAYNFDGFIGRLTLTGFATDETITGAIHDDTLSGGGGNDVLFGLAGNDVLDGGSGDDTLDGGTGADTMRGGDGNDLYIVDNAGDDVIELGGEGTDTVRASISYTLTANVENLVLTGSATDGTGNGLANVITGNAHDNVLSGGAGGDVLDGAAGNDTLDGGTGADKMSGGTGNDLYIVDDAGDQAIELEGGGTDTVRASVSYTLAANVENLVLTGSAANGTGNGLDNVITGNASDNVLSGGAGDDTLDGGAGNDTLDGGTGADTMRGGTGNDVYIVDNAGDVVFELAGEGIDTVRASLSYTLGANVENLVLTGTSNLNGMGNELNNVLTGNAGSNRLNGGAGNDRLIGGDGVDYLTGGAGSDTFVGEINATKSATRLFGNISIDVVLDFQSGVDKIDLSGIDANFGLAGDQAFRLVNSVNPGTGEISIRHFGNVNAAEAALGFDIDGVDGISPYSGAVSVVLGNVDGGDPDFAMIFIGTPDILVSDFLL
jgi:Ca2+-binding RTX toxin-like protein